MNIIKKGNMFLQKLVGTNPNRPRMFHRTCPISYRNARETANLELSELNFFCSFLFSILFSWKLPLRNCSIKGAKLFLEKLVWRNPNQPHMFHRACQISYRNASETTKLELSDLHFFVSFYFPFFSHENYHGVIAQLSMPRADLRHNTRAVGIKGQGADPSPLLLYFKIS